MKTTIKYLFLTAALGIVTASAGDNDMCDRIADSVREQVIENKSAVLEIVKRAVSENEACAGPIVAAAIRASNANDALVGQIVAAAGNAAPGQINNIVAAASGAAPGAAAEINAAAQTVGMGGGLNPLDAPGGGLAGQTNAPGQSSQESAGNTSGQGSVKATNQSTEVAPVITP